MAADPQHRLLLAAAVHVGGVALVLARIQTDVQVGNVELGVVVFAADGETAAGVVDFLPREETGAVTPFHCDLTPGSTAPLASRTR